MLMILRNLFLLSILCHTVSCSTPEGTLNKVFDANELVTLNKIIDFYDNFVQAHLEEKSSIDQDYLDFLNTNCPKVIESGDFSILSPDKTEKINFYKTLDREVLSDIFFINDTVKLFDKDQKEFVETYVPYSSMLNK
jgi:hypothetical protein